MKVDIIKCDSCQIEILGESYLKASFSFSSESHHVTNLGTFKGDYCNISCFRQRIKTEAIKLEFYPEAQKES
jgi:hypothetical protein